MLKIIWRRRLELAGGGSLDSQAWGCPAPNPLPRQVGLRFHRPRDGGTIGSVWKLVATDSS